MLSCAGSNFREANSEHPRRPLEHKQPELSPARPPSAKPDFRLLCELTESATDQPGTTEQTSE